MMEVDCSVIKAKNPFVAHRTSFESKNLSIRINCFFGPDGGKMKLKPSA